MIKNRARKAGRRTRTIYHTRVVLMIFIHEVFSLIAAVVSILLPTLYYLKDNAQKIDILATAMIANYETNPHLNVEALKKELGDAGVTADDFFERMTDVKACL